MRKVLCAIVAVLVMMVMVLPGCAEKEEEAKYKVGVNLALSGFVGDIGKSFRDGFLLGVEQVNQAGGVNGHPIELIVYDNGGDLAKAVLVAKKLINEDRVLMVIGGVGVGTEVAAKPVCEEAEVPFLVGASEDELMEPPATFIFRALPGTLGIIAPFYDVWKTMGITKFAAMFVTIDFGMSGKDFVERTHKLMGLEAVAIEQFGIMDVDMTPQLSKVAASGAEALLIYGVGSAGVIASKQAKDMNLGIPIFISPAMVDPDFLETMPDVLEGDISITFAGDMPEALDEDDPLRQIRLNFEEDFMEKYGRPPAHDEPTGYDVALIMAEALRIANPDLADVNLARSQIRDALEKVKVTGTSLGYEFTPEHHDGTALQLKNALIAIEGGETKFLEWIEEIEVLQYL